MKTLLRRQTWKKIIPLAFSLWPTPTLAVICLQCFQAKHNSMEELWCKEEVLAKASEEHRLHSWTILLQVLILNIIQLLSQNQTNFSLIPSAKRKRCWDHVGGLPNCLFKWFPWQMAGVQVTMHGGGIKIALPKSSQTGPIYGTFWKAIANTNYKETVLLRVGIKIECQPYCEFLGAEKSTRR